VAWYVWYTEEEESGHPPGALLAVPSRVSAYNDVFRDGAACACLPVEKFGKLLTEKMINSYLKVTSSGQT